MLLRIFIKRSLILNIVFIVIIIFSGCSHINSWFRPSEITFYIRADKNIETKGFSLTVDIITAANWEEIWEVGSTKFFGHELREKLIKENKIKIITINPGEYNIEKIYMPDDINKIIIFAEYPEVDNIEKQKQINIKKCQDKYYIHLYKKQIKIFEMKDKKTLGPAKCCLAP